MTRKVLTSILSISMAFSLFSFPAYAKENSLENVSVTIHEKSYNLSSEKAYFDKTLNKYVISFSIDGNNIVYHSVDNAIVPFTEVSVNQPKMQSSEDSAMRNVGTWESFRKTSEKKINGSRLKVSADFVAPPAGGAVSKTISFSIQESFSSGLSWATKSALTASASFSWSKSASTSTTYTANLKGGQKGYLAFTPYFMRVSGYAQTWVNDTLVKEKAAYGDSVLLTSDGEPDGRYEFIFY